MNMNWRMRDVKVRAEPYEQEIGRQQTIWSKYENLFRLHKEKKIIRNVQYALQCLIWPIWLHVLAHRREREQMFV